MIQCNYIQLMVRPSLQVQYKVWMLPSEPLVVVPVLYMYVKNTWSLYQGIDIIYVCSV